MKNMIVNGVKLEVKKNLWGCPEDIQFESVVRTHFLTGRKWVSSCCSTVVFDSGEIRVSIKVENDEDRDRIFSDIGNIAESIWKRARFKAPAGAFREAQFGKFRAVGWRFEGWCFESVQNRDSKFEIDLTILERKALRFPFLFFFCMIHFAHKS